MKLNEICEQLEDGKQVYRLSEGDKRVVIVELDEYLGLLDDRRCKEYLTDCQTGGQSVRGSATSIRLT